MGSLTVNYQGLTKNAKIFSRRLWAALYPNIYSSFTNNLTDDERRAAEWKEALEVLEESLASLLGDPKVAAEKTAAFGASFEAVHQLVTTDVRAAYLGDPAAISEEEVVLCYPSFKAVSLQRFAHVLYTMGVPVFPRMVTEYAHGITGIDIHPGAEIGSSFFIDHGTGVVVGETSTIGDRVKLYQNVTIGAKSFELGEDGNPVKGIKRHPDIGDDVVIYAGATILGGETRIGNGCVVGGNVWLTHSLEDGKTVTL